MISDFERQWHKFTSTIESSLIRQSKTGVISVDIINKEICDYFRQWTYDSTSNGVWLSRIKKQSESGANKIIEATEQIKLNKLPFNRPSMAPYYLVVILVGAVAYFIASSLDVVWWKTILSTLIGIILGSTVILPMGQQKVSKYDRSVVCKYMQQITPHKQKIIDIISKL